MNRILLTELEYLKHKEVENIWRLKPIAPSLPPPKYKLDLYIIFKMVKINVVQLLFCPRKYT